MPTSTLANGYHNVIDSHEERLQRVEGTLHDVSNRVAEIGVTTEYLKDSTEKQHVDISGKIESLFTELRNHNEKIVDKLSDHTLKLDDLEDRIKPVESHLTESAAKHKERWDNWKKILVGAGLAVAGVLGTKAAEWLLTQLG